MTNPLLWCCSSDFGAKFKFERLTIMSTSSKRKVEKEHAGRSRKRARKEDVLGFGADLHETKAVLHDLLSVNSRNKPVAELPRCLVDIVEGYTYGMRRRLFIGNIEIVSV